MKQLLIDRSIAKQQKIYKGLFSKFGASRRSLHWNSEDNQIVRFEQLLKAGDLNGAKILDIGCGLGDLYGFFQDRNICVDYYGVDIVPEFINAAQKRFLSAKFEVRNILKLPLNSCYDYVYASGIFAFGNRLFFNDLCKAAFRSAKVAFVFNIYTSNGRDPRFFHITNAEIVPFFKTFNPSAIKISAEYLENDATYFVYV
ncbi:hypothetical protein FACS189487_09800 [Campylobacterota bacterium]|nr:hypothetical protein FACS189487_09800 [Campylobacterota bacterium]